MSKAEITHIYSNWLGERKPDIPTGEIFDPWRLRIMDHTEFAALGKKNVLSTQQLGYLTAFGLLAPSTHNVVPQRFKLHPEENSIEVLIDKKSILPQSDPDGRQSVISAGCAISNIDYAAKQYGLETNFTANVETTILAEQAISLGKIHLKKDSVQTEDPRWLQAILDRKVVRALYDETAIDPALTKVMEKRAQDQYSAVRFKMVTSHSEVHLISKLQEDADRTVYERQEFLAELGEWFYPNSMTTIPKGMRGREFGLDDEHSLELHQGFNHVNPLLPDQIAGLARGGRASMESSSGIGIITAPVENIRSRIEAGKLYEDLALLAHVDGYCTAVHAGITEVPLPNQTLTTQLSLEGKPLMIFRIGKPEYDEDRLRPHSARPLLPDIIL